MRPVSSPNVIQTATACQRQQRPKAASYLSSVTSEVLPSVTQSMPALRGLRVVLIGSHTHTWTESQATGNIAIVAGQSTLSTCRHSHGKIWTNEVIDKCSGSRQSLNRISDALAGLVWYLMHRTSLRAMTHGPPHPRRARRGRRCLPSESHRSGRQSLGYGSPRRGALRSQGHTSRQARL